MTARVFRLRGSPTNIEVPLVLTSTSPWPGEAVGGDSVVVQVTSPGGSTVTYSARDRIEFRLVQSMACSDPTGKVRAWLVRPGHWADNPDFGGDIA